MHSIWRRYLPWIWLFWAMVGLIVLVIDALA